MNAPGQTEGALRGRAADFAAQRTLREFGRESLAEISAREGVDFATAALDACVRQSPLHAPFIAEIEGLFHAPPVASAAAAMPLIAVAPAAYYKEQGHTGADGRLVKRAAEQLGAACEIIPLESAGSLDENARIILAWLASRPEPRIILVSLCKGGADIKVALADPGARAAFGRVSAWINICGTLSGSPIANWALNGHLKSLLLRLVCIRSDATLQIARDLRHAVGGPLDARLQMPEAIRLIHLLGFPLRQHLSNAIASRCHRQLARFGPNDGAMLLAEACALPGLIYPVWGADHYLRPEDRAEAVLIAILRYIAREAANEAKAAV